jgi:hypothetical protein
MGTNVVAAQAGRVLEVSQRVSWGESYGTAIIVLHRDMTRAIYAHLSKTLVVRGQQVEMWRQQVERDAVAEKIAEIRHNREVCTKEAALRLYEQKMQAAQQIKKQQRSHERHINT